MIFIFQAIIALFAFFVVAPCVLNAVSLFTVQKRFAKTMIDLGVVQADVVHKLHPKKEIAGVIISLVVVAAFGYGVWRQAPISYLSGGLPLVVGFLKYRQIVQFNSLTVKRFQNTYQGQMDVKKYNDYVNKTFEKNTGALCSAPVFSAYLIFPLTATSPGRRRGGTGPGPADRRCRRGSDAGR